MSMSLSIEVMAHIHELAGYREMPLEQTLAFLEEQTAKQIIRQAGNCIAKAQQQGRHFRICKLCIADFRRSGEA